MICFEGMGVYCTLVYRWNLISFYPILIEFLLDGGWLYSSVQGKFDLFYWILIGFWLNFDQMGVDCTRVHVKFDFFNFIDRMGVDCLLVYRWNLIFFWSDGGWLSSSVQVKFDLFWSDGGWLSSTVQVKFDFFFYRMGVDCLLVYRWNLIFFIRWGLIVF